MSYSLFMNNVNEANTRPRDTRESTLKRSMRRRTRTAPLITPFTCREREGQVGKLYLLARSLHFSPCRIAARWRWRVARRTRPDAMARLQQLFIRCHAVAMLYGR